MSKIIFTLFALILGTGVLMIHKPTQRSLASQAWGKSRSDVSVRIIEREATPNEIALTGEVQTDFENIQVEWRLPEGVSLVEGQFTETLQKNAQESLLRSKIKVSLPAFPVEGHIVFFAYKEENGRKTGHSRVFSLRRSQEKQQHVEKVKAMMRSKSVTESSD